MWNALVLVIFLRKSTYIFTIFNWFVSWMSDHVFVVFRITESMLCVGQNST